MLRPQNQSKAAVEMPHHPANNQPLAFSGTRSKHDLEKSRAGNGSKSRKPIPHPRRTIGTTDACFTSLAINDELRLHFKKIRPVAAFFCRADDSDQPVIPIEVAANHHTVQDTFYRVISYPDRCLRQ